MAKNKQKSSKIRENWVQLDTLCCGMDWDEADLTKTQILIEDVFGDSHPGSVHLDGLGKEAAIGVFQTGGKPARFHGTDICDGWAMLHSGMNYILPSREVICDLVEVHGRVIPWDGMIVISSCDKSIPAHLMALSRLNIPAIHIPGGSNRVAPPPIRPAASGLQACGVIFSIRHWSSVASLKASSFARLISTWCAMSGMGQATWSAVTRLVRKLLTPK